MDMMLKRPAVVLVMVSFLLTVGFLFTLPSFFFNYRPLLVAKMSQMTLNWKVEEKREGRGYECNLFDGNWVWDDSYPLYESRDCPFVDEGFRCSENGRPDKIYTKWRWQPKHCNIPRFDAKEMLEKLRDRKLVFAGDSIGRNQWESLLCMLSSAFPHKDSIYEINGNPITKHMGTLAFVFRDYNCTVEYYRAPYLVKQTHALPGMPKKVVAAISVDVMDPMSKKWRDADILVLNSGHWWSYEKTLKRGLYFQVRKEVKMNMSVESAYERSIKTLFDWVHKEVDTRRTQVIFRTYSPPHFRFGEWNTGGRCRAETLPELNSSLLQLKSWDHLLKPFKNIPSDHPLQEVEVLNITQMTAHRKDGHLSLYKVHPSNRKSLRKQDCSHWCLPGVPDAWNELLYALFLRRESIET